MFFGWEIRSLKYGTDVEKPYLEKPYQLPESHNMTRDEIEAVCWRERFEGNVSNLEALDTIVEAQEWLNDHKTEAGVGKFLIGVGKLLGDKARACLKEFENEDDRMAGLEGMRRGRRFRQAEILSFAGVM